MSLTTEEKIDFIVKILPKWKKERFIGMMYLTIDVDYHIARLIERGDVTAWWVYDPREGEWTYIFSTTEEQKQRYKQKMEKEVKKNPMKNDGNPARDCPPGKEFK